MTICALSLLIALRWAVLLTIALGALSFDIRPAWDPVAGTAPAGKGELIAPDSSPSRGTPDGGRGGGLQEVVSRLACPIAPSLTLPRSTARGDKTVVGPACDRPAGEENAGLAASTFQPVAITIDPHGRPLAAYQIELTTGSPDATLVGVEGGAHRAFAEAPYYDPRALTTGRIILAAFNTGADLPKDATRVATVMVHVAAGAHPRFTATLTVAADHDAHAIAATVTALPLPRNASAPAGPTDGSLYPGAANPRPSEGAHP